MNGGLSLLDVKRKREEALALIESNEKKTSLILMFTTAYIVIFLLIIIFTTMYKFSSSVAVNLIAQAISATPIIVGVQWMRRLDTSNENSQKRIRSFDDIFALFGNSFESIDCLSLSDKCGMIDESCVSDRLVGAAYGILDSKAIFESVRSSDDSDWQRVSGICSSIEQREKEFNTIWETATKDFDLVLNKKSIFDQAAKELKRDNEARVPAK